MPNCFQLTKKGDTEASKLSDVDEAICKHLGVAPHPTRYVDYWFDSIGFGLATGRGQLGSQELREFVRGFSPSTLPKILKFLEENYTSSAWAEVGRR